jgi:hypothetical protein
MLDHMPKSLQKYDQELVDMLLHKYMTAYNRMHEKEKVNLNSMLVEDTEDSSKEIDKDIIKPLVKEDYKEPAIDGELKDDLKSDDTVSQTSKLNFDTKKSLSLQKECLSTFITL